MTSKQQTETCLQCAEPVTDTTYAVYDAASKNKKKLEKNADDSLHEVKGYLCESCRSKNKIKVINSRNELYKLAALKGSESNGSK